MQRVSTENGQSKIKELETKMSSNNDTQAEALVTLQQHMDDGNAQIIAIIREAHDDLKRGWWDIASVLKEKVSQIFITTSTAACSV